ncbi:endonuclease III [Nanoarchaeota archaeon]
MNMYDNIINLIDSLEFQFWWPVDIEYHNKNNGDWRVEIIIGAILTQNTKWDFVEKNINFLKEKNFIFRLENIKNLDPEDIKVPFKNRKLETLKELSNFIINKYGSLDNFSKNDLYKIREELLNINGIGKETADAIILYSIEKPIFVVDYYTKLFFNKFIEYDKLRIEIEEIVKNNINNIEKLFLDKLKNYKEIKYPFLSVFDLRKNIDYDKKLVIIYKELHAMIDIKMKSLK